MRCDFERNRPGRVTWYTTWQAGFCRAESLLSRPGCTRGVVSWTSWLHRYRLSTLLYYGVNSGGFYGQLAIIVKLREKETPTYATRHVVSTTSTSTSTTTSNLNLWSSDNSQSYSIKVNSNTLRSNRKSSVAEIWMSCLGIGNGKKLVVNIGIACFPIPLADVLFFSIYHAEISRTRNFPAFPAYELVLNISERVAAIYMRLIFPSIISRYLPQGGEEILYN